MRVFISWSGEQSKQIALLLKEWLPSVIQALDPWVSSADIEKGEKWFSSISDSLVNASGMGIFCLTRDNLNAPWMAFEAGAIAVHDRARVATFLHEVKPDEVKPPLGLFQGTDSANKADVHQLLQTMNKRIASPLQESRLEKTFNTNWIVFQDDLAKIKAGSAKKVAEPDQKALMHEILATVRRIEKDAFRRPDSSDPWLDSDPSNPVKPSEPQTPYTGGLLGLALKKNEASAANLAAALRAFDKNAQNSENLGKYWAMHEMKSQTTQAMREQKTEAPAARKKITLVKKKKD